MKPFRLYRVAALLLALVTAVPLVSAQDRGEGALNPAEPKGTTPQEIIQRFAAKEKEFKQARDQYTYRQTVKVQTLDGDTPDGEFQEVFDVLFDDKGRRTQQMVFAPQSTLQRVQMTRQDFQDIETMLPFVLTSDEIPDYSILYVGQQQQDELHCYVFDIAPKQIDRSKRYFQGRIWVDDRDFQVVKTKGKTVPDIREKGSENLFPGFTTWREQIDGRYWFPTYTRVDDTLHFKNNDVRIREIVKYSNYKRFGSNVKITYEGQEVQKPGEAPTTPKKK
jgi:outer membrane lipoprotein-sorting protein